MHAVRFNGDVSSWSTSSVTNLSETFFGAFSFNGDVSAWDVRKVENLTKLVGTNRLIDEQLTNSSNLTT
jgi:Mycoplasma protein of unknown function, DUF285